MNSPDLAATSVASLDQVLGYFNFSSGAVDVQFLSNLNKLYGLCWSRREVALQASGGKVRAAGPSAPPRASGAKPKKGKAAEAKPSGEAAGEQPSPEKTLAPAESQGALARDEPAGREPLAAAPPWRELHAHLRARLEVLAQTSPAFRDSSQCRALLELVFERFPPAYRAFHADLLFHQTDEQLFNGLFLGRVTEAVLQQGPPWEETERILAGTIDRLNDFVGHRPVAVLEKHRHEPYAHEWVRPVPLYIQGVGAAAGPYHEVVDIALRLLRETEPSLLRAACFDPEALEELAYDPKAYDFDHPANKRPNYHFGQWDPHYVDNRGRYRRFVAQQVTLETLMKRVWEVTDLPRDEILFEAAAVLAGTLLMATGVSGAGPDTHDSSVSLGTLLPSIATYRDAFYEQLQRKVTGEHAKRLSLEAAERRQPFGGARQHLNAELARRRAAQLERVHLARLFARMGYPEAASQQAAQAPVASARVLCEIDCRLTTGHLAVDAGRLEEAAAFAPEIFDLLRRGIECGAVVDPWNVLGFDGNFSLFPAVENSIRDHRVDELLAIMEQYFRLHARVWSEAAARDDQPLCQKISRHFRQACDWWRQFAVHTVSGVEGADALQVFQAAEHVAKCLNLWHKAGAAAGDLAFWKPHAALFATPSGYALVIRELRKRGDYVAAMALLVHWLSQSESVPLQLGESSFHVEAVAWFLDVRRAVCAPAAPAKRRPGKTASEEALAAWAAAAKAESQRAWKTILKFFDLLEANAEQYWSAPRFSLETPGRGKTPSAAAVDEEPRDDDDVDQDDDLFGAAYERMIYRDSTDDGVEGETADSSKFSGDVEDDALEAEVNRVGDRLDFLNTLARLWKGAVLGPLLPRGLAEPTAGVMVGGGDTPAGAHPVPPGEKPVDGAAAAADASDAEAARATLEGWIFQAERMRRELLRLVDEVQRYRLPKPSGDHDSLVEYDRRRLFKETLLERVIAATVEIADASRLLQGALAAHDPPAGARLAPGREDAPLEERRAVALLASLLRQDLEQARFTLEVWSEDMKQLPLLYVPLSKGGSPREIILARARQQMIQDCLAWLPRLGLLTETCRLIETARVMERANPVGPGAVTEFDELFEMGYKALVESLAVSAEAWEKGSGRGSKRQVSRRLVESLEHFTQSLLVSWLSHSKTLRLSVLEKVRESAEWERLVLFIQRHGDKLFTQRFFNLGNIRAILHQGVAAWLRQLEDEPREEASALVDEIARGLPRDEAIEQLTLVLEAIIENYGEYRDYNSTTTQSDRGSMLYTLLDFLRLRGDYERIAWNLKPVVWAHEILVRKGYAQAAEMWRRSLYERIHEEAEKYLKRLAALQKKYAMRMPTVADRLNERFVRPMVIDRIRALVAPAMRAVGETSTSAEFELLQRETEDLTREPTGVGLELPAWLAALIEEVEECRQPIPQRGADAPAALLAFKPLSPDEVERQLRVWTDEPTEGPLKRKPRRRRKS